MGKDRRTKAVLAEALSELERENHLQEVQYKQYLKVRDERISDLMVDLNEAIRERRDWKETAEGQDRQMQLVRMVLCLPKFSVICHILTNALLSGDSLETYALNFVDAVRASAREDEESLRYDVLMRDHGEKKILAIKELRELLGLSLLDAKNAVESGVFAVGTDLSRKQAAELMSRFAKAGCTMEMIHTD